MDNAETHRSIDGAVHDQRWEVAYMLANDAIQADPDDHAARMKAGLAKFRLGDYQQAASLVDTLCLNLLFAFNEGEINKAMILVYIHARLLGVLCQLRSIGGSTSAASIQAYDLRNRMGEWQKAELLSSTDDMSLLHELERALGLA